MTSDSMQADYKMICKNGGSVARVFYFNKFESLNKLWSYYQDEGYEVHVSVIDKI
jgi:hypothetical protein